MPIKLKNRVAVKRCDLGWAQDLVEQRHYLQRKVDRRALPFAYRVELDGVSVGAIVLAIPHWTRQNGLFQRQQDWQLGDELPTQWQVLVVSRVWLDPSVQVSQPNGHASNIASCAIAKVLKRVQRDWIEHHPPRFPSLPYHVRLVIAHSDLGWGHKGVIYSAANFQFWGKTQTGRSRHGTVEKTSTKAIWIYRLSEPNWLWEPEAKQLELLAG